MGNLVIGRLKVLPKDGAFFYDQCKLAGNHPSHLCCSYFFMSTVIRFEVTILWLSSSKPLIWTT